MKYPHGHRRPISPAIIFSFLLFFPFTAKVLAAAPNLAFPNNSQISSDSSIYHVVERDANSRVWERTSLERNSSGEVVPQKHRYTELATGLNHLKNGQWVESRAQIELLPDGRAAATEGQHQCYFPANIHEGLIETVTAEGKHLKSRPIGLSYGDGSNTVLIAELKDSTGFILGANQVVYPDAFAGFKADLRYTYTIAGFEQDIILREQPPTPEALGLNAQTARLQVLTEFIDTEEPSSSARFSDSKAGLTDHQLVFGSLKMIQGRTFSLTGTAATGSSLQDSPVFKSWHHQGTRSYLVEEVPFLQIRSEIEQLPSAAPRSFVADQDPVLFKLAANRLLPPFYVAKSAGQNSHLARVSQWDQSGFVLDYITISYTVSQNNYTFKSDTTYFLSNAYFQDSGTDTIEGGTVIKFDNNSASLNLNGPMLSCQTGPYRPAIITAKDDNSVGEIIAGSTGTPSGYYGSANNALYVNSPGENLMFHDVRMSWLKTAVRLGVSSARFDNVQFINCDTALRLGWANLTINNALFANVNLAVANAGGNPGITGTFVTVHNCGNFAGANMGPVSLANCLLVTTTNITSGTLLTNNVAMANSDVGVFQTVGGGAHYLATGSPYRDAGIKSMVDPSILAQIALRTTYPPLICTNTVFSAPTNFSIQAPRDNDLPDLGYHYDPIDYITDGLVVNSTSLGIDNGVVTACYNRPGIILKNGSSLASVGTPLQPNWFVRYQSVQELAAGSAGATTQSGQNVVAVWSAAAPATGSFIFSHFSAPANGGAHFNSTGLSAYGQLTVQNSEIWGGTNDFSGATQTSTTTLNNNLFYRSTLLAVSPASQVALSVSNNLFLQSAITLIQPGAGSWSFFNNTVDSSSIAANSRINSGYNAYVKCPFTLPGTGNLILTNALNYLPGPLGNYYQPTNSPLVDAGSITASQAGFFHFTTQINEAKEAGSMLDIGYHYVAVDANSLPFDNNQDGIPDYLQDVNGNGLTDSQESPWVALPVFTLQPTNEVLYPGSNIVFNTALTGLNVGLQWYYNSITLPGETNATLVINNVLTSNAGVYYLVATNFAGSVSSSNAVLARLAPPTIITQPTNQTVLQSGNATFAINAIGYNLNYQWYSNSIPLPNATNASLTVCAFSANSGGVFYATVTNSAGGGASLNATLTVQPISGQTIIYAKSAAYADVSQAVASARDGNLVLIPPGTQVWTQALYLNGVSLRGCGTNQTILIDGVTPDNNSGTIITMIAGTNGLTELSNFQIQASPNNNALSYAGIVVATGVTTTDWRIDHMFFNGLYSKNITTHGNARCVIDHNTFFLASIGIWSADSGDQFASYYLPATYGLNSANSLYIEDNYFTNIVGTPRQSIDGCSGSRMVFRYNTIWNDYCGNHGNETGGDNRSQRSLEVYENKFTYAPGLANPNNAYFAMCLFRGGSCVVFSNTASGYQASVVIRNLRNTDTFSGKYYPYGGANGVNPWDSNSPAVFQQGTHTGPNGAYFLQVDGASWTPNQWVGYTVDNTNNGLFSMVVTNSANTIYYLGNGVVHNTVLYFNTGDAFALYKVYATIDQPGRGSGDLLQQNGYDSQGNEIVINTATGVASWPHEVIEPMYFWGNLLNGTPAEVSSPYPSIQEGRDFFNDTPKPDYAPFPYPHPLTLMGVH